MTIIDIVTIEIYVTVLYTLSCHTMLADSLIISWLLWILTRSEISVWSYKRCNIWPL